MSAEADLRAVLLADAALTALVPAGRISIDAVAQGAPRPYIAFAKQRTERLGGLDNSLHAQRVVIDLQVVGTNRPNAITVREQLEETLLMAGVPFDEATAGYDGENDLEVEVLTIDWWVT